MKTVRRDGVLDGQDRRQAARYSAFTRAAPESRGFQRFAQHPRDRLAMIQDLGGKQRLVVTVGAGVAFAGHIVAGECGHDTPGSSSAGVASRCKQQRVRVRRQNRPGMQQTGEAAHQIVGVERLAGDVAARAFMRHRLPAIFMSRLCQFHQNFSSSFAPSRAGIRPSRDDRSSAAASGQDFLRALHGDPCSMRGRAWPPPPRSRESVLRPRHRKQTAPARHDPPPSSRNRKQAATVLISSMRRLAIL